jgi:hypothetical protein
MFSKACTGEVEAVLDSKKDHEPSKATDPTKIVAIGGCKIILARRMVERGFR